MKQKISIILVIILLITNSLFAKKQNYELKLSESVLMNSNRVVSSSIGQGRAGIYTPEILAFNIIYNSDNPAALFKEIYKKVNTAGKIYCIVGLYFLKDKEFEKYKKDFLTTEQQHIYTQYGCKGKKNNDAKWVLNQWLEGIPNNLWYTKILINSINEIDVSSSLIKNIKSILKKTNINIDIVNIIEIKLLNHRFFKGNKYVIVARGICADKTFKSKFEDELFGIFLTDSNLFKISKTLDIFPTKRWNDYKVVVDKIEENKFSIIGKGITYNDQKLVKSYVWSDDK